MKITALNIPANRFENGLGAITMNHLGGVVVLAGANGSGKSRLLRVLSQIRSSLKVRHRVEPIIKSHTVEIAKHPAHSRAKQWEKELKDAQKDYDDTKWFSLSDGTAPGIVAFTPKACSLRDPYNHAQKDLFDSAKLAAEPGTESLPNSTLAVLQLTQNRWWEATHDLTKLTPGEVANSTESYQRLQGLVKQFLGTELTRSGDGQAELFGRRIGESLLSDGQIVLLQLCVAIHQQSASIKDLILVLDEPENHLHPAAMLQAIGDIQRGVGEGQLWIATHSVPLLAQFEPEALWWMDRGIVQYAGNAPQTVLRGLLGTEVQISRTADFLSLPATLAGIRFAFQALLPPEATLTGEDDPQMRQAAEYLKPKDPTQKFRALDYGAGKGRLAAFLNELDPLIGDWLEYVALENGPSTEACKASIARLYGSAEGRFFTTEPELLSGFAPGSFDVIVLCNVLHEIPAEAWLELFRKEAAIQSLLKPDGHLIIIEDMRLPIGEKPHQKGFLVLDTRAIKTLFRICPDDGMFQEISSRGDRLKAFRIPQPCIARVTSESRLEAIRQLSHRARQEIRGLRNAEPSYQNGRLHAFWVHQFANAQLVLSEHINE